MTVRDRSIHQIQHLRGWDQQERPHCRLLSYTYAFRRKIVSGQSHGWNDEWPSQGSPPFYLAAGVVVSAKQAPVAALTSSADTVLSNYHAARKDYVGRAEIYERTSGHSDFEYQAQAGRWAWDVFLVRQ
jgi:hypothetical protein